MTELSWLIDLLLNHKLNAETKKHVSERISYVETQINTKPYIPFQTQITAPNPSMVVVNGAQQSPSTIAAMARHGVIPPGPTPPPPPTEPIIIASTPATAAAMNSRQQAIEMALSGKNEKGRTSPRKF